MKDALFLDDFLIIFLPLLVATDGSGSRGLRQRFYIGTLFRSYLLGNDNLHVFNSIMQSFILINYPFYNTSLNKISYYFLHCACIVYIG